MKALRSFKGVTTAALMVICVFLSGCSGGDDRAESPELKRCKSLLGAGNVEAAVGTTGAGDVQVSGTPQADVLANRLVQEAEKWKPSDLQHDSHTGCRMDAFEGDRATRTVDVSVKWSVLSLGMMEDPKNRLTWHRVNKAVYVAPEPGPGRTQLLAVCAVPGAPASQSSDPPLRFEVAGVTLGAELRWQLLRTFARSVTEEMGCATPPEIPSALPTAA
ncbi:hypothetical protein ABZ371_08505 [Streptomyces sp. NPDC005899]|uniref:hypothetical protein n=1 Tax=Streptomyces sp. NPDC005899 TaxID=3155716 RepID=UPI00340BDDEF